MIPYFIHAWVWMHSFFRKNSADIQRCWVHDCNCCFLSKRWHVATLSLSFSFYILSNVSSEMFPEMWRWCYKCLASELLYCLQNEEMIYSICPWWDIDPLTVPLKKNLSTNFEMWFRFLRRAHGMHCYSRSKYCHISLIHLFFEIQSFVPCSLRSCGTLWR